MKRKIVGTVLAASLLTLGLLGLAGCSASETQAQTEAPKAEKALDFEGVTFSDYKVFEAPGKSLRGMAVSPDGAFIYASHIQINNSGIRKIDIATGEVVWAYRDAKTAPADAPLKEYPKSVAVDDRGYVYGMISYNQKTGSTLAVINDADGTPVSEQFIDFGQIDSGANGIAVRKNGDKYLAYFISNYGPNRVYCYDVTDPANPVPYTEFGVDGIATLAKVTGVAQADANYLAFDDEGSIYLTIKLADGEKADAVGKLSNDGKTFEKVVDCPEAYGICIADGFMFVSTYNGEASAINVYSMSDYGSVATLAADVPDHSHYSQVVMGGDKLYVADQSYQTGSAADDLGSRILVSNSLVKQ